MASKTLFAIFATANPTASGEAIVSTYGQDSLEVLPGQWLVADQGTAKDVSDRLGISAGTAGTAIVVSVSGYFGRQPANVWEWITARLTAAASSANDA